MISWSRTSPTLSPAPRGGLYLKDPRPEAIEETLAAVKKLVPLIRRTSAERVRAELTMMLTGPHPESAFELLRETGLLREVLPEAAEMEGVEQPPQFHPEGDARGFIVRIHIYKDYGYFPPESAQDLIEAVENEHTPEAQLILKRFVDIYRHQSS